MNVEVNLSLTVSWLMASIVDYSTRLFTFCRRTNNSLLNKQNAASSSWWWRTFHILFYFILIPDSIQIQNAQMTQMCVQMSLISCFYLSRNSFRLSLIYSRGEKESKKYGRGKFSIFKHGKNVFSYGKWEWTTRNYLFLHENERSKEKKLSE